MGSSRCTGKKRAHVLLLCCALFCAVRLILRKITFAKSKKILAARLLTRQLCVSGTGGAGAADAAQSPETEDQHQLLQEKLARARAMKPVVGGRVNTSVPDLAAGGR